jgi:tRNA(fMet)-specific endonuclease VapC
MAQEAEFLVDTSVLIAHIRKTKSQSLFDLTKIAFGQAAISEIVIFELEVGAIRASRSQEFERRFGYLTTFPITQVILMRAAEVHVTLLRRNQIIDLADTIIAATALEHDLPLFTLNTAHFQRVPNLRLLTLP